MKFLEFESVCLLKDLPKENLKIGDIGVVVTVHKMPNEAYEVEFVDEFGRPKAQIVLLPGEIKKYDKNK